MSQFLFIINLWLELWIQIDELSSHVNDDIICILYNPLLFFFLQTVFLSFIYADTMSVIVNPNT